MDELTLRELEVLAFLAKVNNKAIAEAFITEHTVKKHIGQILEARSP